MCFYSGMPIWVWIIFNVISAILKIFKPLKNHMRPISIHYHTLLSINYSFSSGFSCVKFYCNLLLCCYAQHFSGKAKEITLMRMNPTSIWICLQKQEVLYSEEKASHIVSYNRWHLAHAYFLCSSLSLVI